MRLNVTYRGHAVDFEVQVDPIAHASMSDTDWLRIAGELIISGQAPWHTDEAALANFVVDRLTDRDGQPSIYVRPKVPFGSGTPLPDKHCPTCGQTRDYR